MSHELREEILVAVGHWTERADEPLIRGELSLTLDSHLEVYPFMQADVLTVCNGKKRKPPDDDPNSLPPKPGPAPPPALPAGALWLSPLETRIVALLTGRDWTRAAELASLLGESETGDLRAVLRNLTERRILASATGKGKGYRIRRPGDA